VPRGAQILHPSIHDLVGLRFTRYGAGDSATRLPGVAFSGSKTTRTLALKALATRRNMLNEWPS
jgi:hypothetical protein